MPRALIWLVLVVAWFFGGGLVGPRVRAGGPAVFAIVGLVAFTCFWWATMWLLLAGRVPWRRLFPSAVATGVFYLGMDAVFALAFSGMVTSNDKKYGPIGIVFSLMSYLIAIGAERADHRAEVDEVSHPAGHELVGDRDQRHRGGGKLAGARIGVGPRHGSRGCVWFSSR